MPKEKCPICGSIMFPGESPEDKWVCRECGNKEVQRTL